MELLFSNRFDIQDDVLKGLDTGDIFLFAGTTVSSFLVREFTHTQWSHIGIVYCPDKHSSSLPEHVCSGHKSVDIDKYGNMSYVSGESNEKIIFVENTIEGSIKNMIKEEFRKEDLYRYKTQRDYMDAYDMKYNPYFLSKKTEDLGTQDRDSSITFLRARKKYPKRCKFSQTPIIHHQLLVNQKENPHFHPWQNKTKDGGYVMCYRCLVERYHNIPLLLESVRNTSDGIIDLLTGYHRSEGVRLVPVCERILSASYQSIAVRKILFQKSSRDLLVGLNPSREKIHMFQRNILETVLPLVAGKDFETHSLDLARAWYHTYPFGSNIEDESSFFCSELVAMTLKHMGVLEHRTPCSHYAPKHFSESFTPPLIFKKKMYFSKELLLKPKGQE